MGEREAFSDHGSAINDFVVVSEAETAADRTTPLSVEEVTDDEDLDGTESFLELRRDFGVNLAGVHGRGDWDPDWFRTTYTVRPGDLGLVARLPHRDGSSRPS